MTIKQGRWYSTVISRVEAGTETQILDWLQDLEDRVGSITLLQQLTCDNGAQMLFAHVVLVPPYRYGRDHLLHVHHKKERISDVTANS